MFNVNFLFEGYTQVFRGTFDVVSDLKVSRRRTIWHLLRKTLVPESVRKNFFV